MNNYINQIKGSASMELIAKAKELKEKGVDVIGLGGGEPDFDTPQSIKEVAISELLRGNTHYSIGKGILKLRESISHKLYSDNGINVSSEEIIVTPGAKMAIYLAVRACINVGDEVMILKPGWVSYKEIVVSAGGIPVEVELQPENGYKLLLENLEEKVTKKTRILIVNTPNNPTGRVLTIEEINVIKEFVRNRNIVIISDEVYEKIVFDGLKTISPASDLELRAKTITINGFSKGYAMTGWRVGYLAADKKFINVILKLYTHTITGIPPFIQEAAAVALGCNEEIEWMRNEYEKRINRFITELNRIYGISVELPNGAFYAWVKFENYECNSKQLAKKLLEKAHVIGVPGQAYSDNANEYIRFSFANHEKELLEAVKRIANVM